MKTDLVDIVNEMLKENRELQVFRLGSETHEMAVEVRISWLKELSTGITDVKDSKYLRDPAEVLH